MVERGQDARKPVVHRPPTLATVKQLYATAFRCAEPECSRPLFKLNNETGEQILNSTVAHIHARSEGGPRWNAEMSEAENRSAGNLVLLCFEHSSEVDRLPDKYPAERLREWKAKQVAEHVRLQKQWPLTDGEAQDVATASFGPQEYGMAFAVANQVTAAARAAGLLAEVARRQRQGPAEVALAWRQMRTDLQSRLPRAWDAATGELLPPGEPPMVQTRQFEAALVQALTVAQREVDEQASLLVGELRAVQAVRTALSQWCDWMVAAARVVVNASGRWPGLPPEEDDCVLSDALAELDRASTALSAAWRGDPAERPPEPAPAPPQQTESEGEQRARAHLELLENARRWKRVKTLPFDASIYDALVASAQFVIDLPSVISHITHDMPATLGLAADVARNADDEMFAALIEQAARAQPLALAAHLLRQLMFAARESERSELEAAAHAAVENLLNEAYWADPAVWKVNGHHMSTLLGWKAQLGSAERVRTLLARHLTERPDLLEAVLYGLSTHVERWSASTGGSVIVAIPAIPDWLPAQELAAQIRDQLPDTIPLDPDEDGYIDDDVRRLASHVLYLNGRTN